MDLIPLLEQARELIIVGWTRDHPAKDKDGNRTCVYGDEACRFCALGAADRVSRNIEGGYSALAFYLRQNLPEGYSVVSEYNDERQTQKRDIVRLYNRAIKFLKKIMRDNNESDPTID